MGAEIWGYIVLDSIEGLVNVVITCCPCIHLLLVYLELQMEVGASLLMVCRRAGGHRLAPFISAEQKAQSRCCGSNNAHKQILLK